MCHNVHSMREAGTPSFDRDLRISKLCVDINRRVRNPSQARDGTSAHQNCDDPSSISLGQQNVRFVLTIIHLLAGVVSAPQLSASEMWQTGRLMAIRRLLQALSWSPITSERAKKSLSCLQALEDS